MSATLRIEHTCPQCGGPVELAETDRILACRYCRVRLYLSSPEPFRYYFPQCRAEAPEIFYAPYLRMRGMEFVCTGTGVRGRVVDVTKSAAAYPALPGSLGLRPQAMTLRFVPEQSGMRLLARSPAPEQATGTEENGPDVWLRRYIGETLSFVYAPFYVRDGVLHDAVLDRSCDDAEPPQAFDEQAVPRLIFVPTLCPQCGWQLSGDKESCVMVCATCCTAWRPEGFELRPIPCALIADDSAADLYVPFWRMEASVAGIALQTYADFARYANLPKAIMAAWERQQLFFWAPAFKIQPPVFLRIARHMTIAQPDGNGTADFKRRPLHPVTLPADEAAHSIIVVLADIAKRRHEAYPLLARAQVQIAADRLVYFPFTRSGGDFVHGTLGFGIQAAALQFGACL